MTQPGNGITAWDSTPNLVFLLLSFSSYLRQFLGCSLFQA